MIQTSAISRYYTMINLLTEGRRQACIPDISNILKVPVTQVRKDMRVLADSPVTGSAFCTSTSGFRALILHYTPRQDILGAFSSQKTGPESSAEWPRDTDAACPYTGDETWLLQNCFGQSEYERMKADLLEGKLDDIPFLFHWNDPEMRYRNGEEIFHIFLSSSEILALNEACPEFIRQSLDPGFTMKTILPELSLVTRDLVSVTFDAIQLDSRLSIQWKTRSSDIQKAVIRPVGLFQNMEDGYIFCIGADGTCIPVSRMISCERTSEPLTSSEILFTPEDVRCMWGIPVDREDGPADVRILFIPKTPNLIEKVRIETRGRAFSDFRKTSDGTWIYTDRVFGMDGFRRWLRSYGSSAVVLEPSWLADKMRRSAEGVLRCYETNEFEW